MDSFKNARILVTGGAGFVGGNLCRRLLEDAPAQIIVVDNLLSAEIDNLPEGRGVEFVHGSITNDRILAALPEGLDNCFHLATYHGNQSSMHDPLADHENNTLTTLKLLERLKDLRGLRRLVYASAGCTVAHKTFEAAEATRETDPVSLHLDSPYQISKIIGEFYGNYYFARHGVPFVKARFQNVYGPGEILGAGQWRGTPATVWRNVTPTFIWKALRGEALPVDNGGIATRDFIYVDDVVRVMMWLLATPSVSGLFNVGTGKARSFKDLMLAAHAALGAAPNIRYIDMPEPIRGSYQYFTQSDGGRLTRAGYNGGFTALEEAVGIYVKGFLDSADRFR